MGNTIKTFINTAPDTSTQDKTIVGFTHTHFSGTGHSDLGDFLIMPTTGRLQLNPGIATDPESGFRSGFTHTTEVAEPDYYKVMLDKYDISLPS